MTPTRSDEGFLEFGDRRTWYRSTGDPSDRPALLVLHGGPGAATGNSLDFVAAVAADRQVIEYDQLDTGRSSRVGDVSQYTVDAHVAELAAVREVLGLSQVHLLGASWGGMLAMSYALTRPEGIRSITLASAPYSSRQWVEAARGYRAGLDRGTLRALERCERTIERQGPPRAKAGPGPTSAALVRQGAMFARALGPASSAPVQAMARALTVLPPLRRPLYSIVSLPFIRRHVFRRGSLPAGAAAGFAGMNVSVYERMWGPSEHHCTGALRDFDLTDRLHEIDVPVLVTSGGHECVLPEHVKQLIDRVRDVEWELFEDCAHVAPYEEPARYTAVLNAFLGRVDAQC